MVELCLVEGSLEISSPGLEPLGADPNGNTHRFLYEGDHLTQIESEIRELGVRRWSYGYDSKGFLLSKTDPRGFTKGSGGYSQVAGRHVKHA
ncbi:MAG: hypothetical protein HY697_03475 [Deltaproteobacteria bacterium]|nr:hypothetical protein [Deltaproteobacteria bacterium]